MKKLIVLFTLMILPSFVLATWGQGTAVKKGTYVEICTAVAGSSDVVKIVAANPKATDLILRNETTYDMIISSVVDTINFSTIPAIAASCLPIARNGFRLKPNETFSPQGMYTGDLWIIFGDGAASTTVKTLRLIQNEP